MIKMNRVVEEVRVIGEPAPTHGIWVNVYDIIRIEEDHSGGKTWVWAANTPAFEVMETPAEILKLMEDEWMK